MYTPYAPPLPTGLAKFSSGRAIYMYKAIHSCCTEYTFWLLCIWTHTPAQHPHAFQTWLALCKHEKHGCACFSTPTYQQCPCFKAHCHPLTVNLYILSLFFSNYMTQQTFLAHPLYFIPRMNISSKWSEVMKITIQSTKQSGDEEVSEQFTVNFINP